MATQLTIEERHRAKRIPNGADPGHWLEVVRSGGGVALCLSPSLAADWSNRIASGLGARAVYLGPDVVEAIRG